VKEVHLSPAFSFSCDSCGKESFVRPYIVEDPEVQRQAVEKFRSMMELAQSPEEASQWDGEISMVPTEVTCAHCQTTFAVAPGDAALEVLDMFIDDWEDDDAEEWDEDSWDEQEEYDDEEDLEEDDDEDSDGEFYE
jgi:hypothetical protein